MKVEESVQNFFVLVDDEEAPVLRIPVTRELQRQLSTLFRMQREAFLHSDLDEVNFDGSYVPDESEILVIKNYKVPESVWEAVRNPAGCSQLSMAGSLPAIRAVFTGQGGASPTLAVQAFDKHQVISRSGLSIINAEGTFKKLEEPGLMLADRLTACFRDQKLYCRSYPQAKRIFDLSEYYREATDKELGAFSKAPGVHFPDEASLARNADTWVRRKIGFIADSKILQREPLTKIATAAEQFGLTVDVKKVKGKRVIVFPAERRPLKQLLKFLDEDHYKAPITGTHFISNSKRRAD